MDVFIKKKKTVVEKGKINLGKEQKARLVFFPPLPIFKGFRNERIKACSLIFPFTETMSFPCPHIQTYI